jgi:hypothetical protein
MTIQRMELVSIVGDDLAAATEFFVELGLEPQGEGSVEGAGWTASWGLDGVRAEVVTPDGHGRLELTKFHTPSTQGGSQHAPAKHTGHPPTALVLEDQGAKGR